jgi:hypothetical protein
MMPKTDIDALRTTPEPQICFEQQQESFAMFENNDEEKEPEPRCYRRPTRLFSWKTHCWCFKKETDCAIFAFLTFGVVSG